MSCSQEAAVLGRKVMVLDFVVPSPRGTAWGERLSCCLGGLAVCGSHRSASVLTIAPEGNPPASG